MLLSFFSNSCKHIATKSLKRLCIKEARSLHCSRTDGCQSSKARFTFIKKWTLWRFTFCHNACLQRWRLSIRIGFSVLPKEMLHGLVQSRLYKDKKRMWRKQSFSYDNMVWFCLRLHCMINIGLKITILIIAQVHIILHLDNLPSVFRYMYQRYFCAPAWGAKVFSLLPTNKSV